MLLKAPTTTLTSAATTLRASEDISIRDTNLQVVPYVAVNIYNYSGLVVLVTNNLIGLIFSRVGYRDLGICFGNKPGP